MNVIHLVDNEVARALGGKVVARGQVRAPGPGHSARDDSMVVWIDAESEYGFRCFSHASDPWRICHDYICQRLGIDRRTDTALGAQRVREVHKQLARERVGAKTEIAHKYARAMSIWDCSAELLNSITTRYFAGRRLDVSQLGDMSHVLRWNEQSHCIVALMTHPRDVHARKDGDCEPARTGIHRTFLDANGYKTERRMLAPTGVIRLSRDEDVTVRLNLCEGLEDGLALLLDGISPVWVMASAGPLSAFPVLSGIESLFVHADSDARGMDAAADCVARWNAAGKKALVVPPPLREMARE